MRDDRTQWSPGHRPRPGDAGYIDMETYLQHELLRRAEYEALPEVIATREEDRAAAEPMARELDIFVARRQRPLMIASDDGTELTSRAILQWQQDGEVSIRSRTDHNENRVQFPPSDLWALCLARHLDCRLRSCGRPARRRDRRGQGCQRLAWSLSY